MNLCPLHWQADSYPLHHQGSPPALFFSLQNCLSIVGLLWFPINFRIICASSVKNVMDNLIGIALDL